MEIDKEKGEYVFNRLEEFIALKRDDDEMPARVPFSASDDLLARVDDCQSRWRDLDCSELPDGAERSRTVRERDLSLMVLDLIGQQVFNMKNELEAASAAPDMITDLYKMLREADGS